MNSAAVIRLLQANGWVEVRQRGSHKQFRRPGQPGLVTVPHPVADIPAGTLASIRRQSGIDEIR